MRVRRLPPFTYLSFYIPFYTQDPHMDLRGARRFFASCAGPRLGLQSLCLLMSLRCCLCSPSALEPRTLALPFSPPSSPFLIWLRLCFSLAPTWRHVHIVTQGFAGGSLAQGPPGHQAGSLGCVPAGADIRQLLSAAWPLLHARLLIPLRILIPRRISNLRL